MTNRINTLVLKKIAISLSILLGILFAFIALLDSFDINIRFPTISVTTIICLLFLQVTLYTFSSYLWQQLVSIISNTRITIVEAMAHTSIVLGAKYIPGKIWGLATRSLSLHSSGISKSHNAAITTIEQTYAIVFVGINATFALLLFERPLIYLLCSLLLSALYPHCINGAYSIVQFLLKLIKRRELSLATEVRVKSLYFYSLSQTLYWHLLAIIPFILLASLTDSFSFSSYIFLHGAFQLAIIAGYVALFIPGGIGVRESVWILLMSQQVDASTAATLAVLHRLWIMGYDIIASLFGLYTLSKKS